MARSIHTTRASLARLKAQDVSREEVRDEAVERARGELDRKRGMKFGARTGRRPRERGHTALDSISIAATDRGPHVWFPAGEDDVRELLRRLPRGVTDGLARVEMRLGREAQDELAQSDAGGEEPDPFTGRWSYSRFPGAWSGRILGRYRPDAAAIELYAYVIDPAHPLRAVWEPLLRMEALSVLAHEVAHHHDHTERVARGRWLAEDRDAVERYAEAMQHEWTRGVVLPYLRERYAAEIALTERWVARHGGIALPFGALADDPRATGRGGRVHGDRLLWKMSEALGNLAGQVERGEPAWECRMRFARELHFQSRDADALAVIRRVLRARPGEPRALMVMADVLLGLGRAAHAARVARRVAAAEPLNARAWGLLSRAAERLERWDEAEDAATRQIQATEAAGERTEWTVLFRARFRLRSGDVAGALEDADRLAASARPYFHARAEALRARAAAAGDAIPSRRGRRRHSSPASKAG